MAYEFHTLEDPVLPFLYHEDELRAGPRCWRNWHENLEVLYLRTGAAELRCGGAARQLAAGALCVVNPNCFHETHPAPAAGTACLIVGEAFLRQNGLDLSGLELEPFLEPEAVGGRFQPVLEAFRAQGPFAAAERRRAVLELLLWLAQSHAHPRTDAPERPREELLAAARYIRAQMPGVIFVEDVARACGLSPSRLMHTFRDTFGCTVTVYVQRVRCEYAKPLLAAGELSIQECAYRSGFPDASYFTKVFHRCTGQPPAAYRRSVRKNGRIVP